MDVCAAGSPDSVRMISGGAFLPRDEHKGSLEWILRGILRETRFDSTLEQRSNKLLGVFALTQNAFQILLLPEGMAKLLFQSGGRPRTEVVQELLHVCPLVLAADHQYHLSREQTIRVDIEAMFQGAVAQGIEDGNHTLLLDEHILVPEHRQRDDVPVLARVIEPILPRQLSTDQADDGFCHCSPCTICVMPLRIIITAMPARKSANTFATARAPALPITFAMRFACAKTMNTIAMFTTSEAIVQL